MVRPPGRPDSPYVARLLSSQVAIHDPRCTGACDPRSCILDIESLIANVISRHARRDGGWFSESVEEELKAFLLMAAWETAQRFQPKDDGRGSNRLAGWVVWVLHRRVVDFLRDQFGTKRNGVPRPEFVPFEPDKHTVPAHDDYPHEQNGRHLDRTRLSPRAQDQLALLALAIEEDSSVTAVARQIGMANNIERLRAEATVVE